MGPFGNLAGLRYPSLKKNSFKVPFVGTLNLYFMMPAQNQALQFFDMFLAQDDWINVVSLALHQASQDTSFE